MKRVLIITIAMFVLSFASIQSHATILFEENFEGDLSAWTGKLDGYHSGTIVTDPLEDSNHVLTFTDVISRGDIFTVNTFNSATNDFWLSFDYLGYSGDVGDGGGFVGYSEDLTQAYGWLAGASSQYTSITQLHDIGEWEHVVVNFTYEGPLHVVLEDFVLGTQNAFIDNIVLEDPHPVPEPTTLILFGLALIGTVVGIRRKRLFQT